MSGSIYGKMFTISTWGESHGEGYGVVIDGCPQGTLDEGLIQEYLKEESRQSNSPPQERKRIKYA